MARQKKAVGLGDTIAQITKVTGIEKLVKFIAGEDCGCDQRKEILNKLFPYTPPKCLTESEFNYLDSTGVLKNGMFKPTEQRELLIIFNRVFSQRKQPTNCGSCFREVINKLTIVFNEYNEDNADAVS